MKTPGPRIDQETGPETLNEVLSRLFTAREPVSSPRRPPGRTRHEDQAQTHWRCRAPDISVSVALDWRRYLFINVDLSVHLHRMPEGEWVCLDAVTLPEGNGVGIADTRLFDERGAIGRAAQTLLIAER